MPTPDEFRRHHPKDREGDCQAPSSTGAQFHICKNCGISFPHRRRGGNIFHDDLCKGRFDANLRSAYRYVRKSLSLPPQMDFLTSADDSVISLAAFWLEILPNTLTARQEIILGEFSELDELMDTVGPINPSIRHLLRARTVALAIVLKVMKCRDSFDQRLFIHSRELLHDVGLEMPLTPSKIKEHLEHAEAIVKFFVQKKQDLANMLNLTRALMAWGNSLRILGKERAAARRFTWAHNILLQGPYRIAPQNATVAWYFHQASSWLLRTRGFLLNRKQREAEIARMEELARQVNDARLWTQHYRDAAGHASQLLGDHDAAVEHMKSMSHTLVELSSRYLDVTLFRPRIELLFDTGKRDGAINFLRQDYVQFYSDHRDVYYYDLLQRWADEYEFDFGAPLPQPEFASPLLTFLPRRLETPLV